MQRLLVIGTRGKPDPELDAIAEKVEQGNGIDFHVRHCRSPRELVPIVDHVAKRYGRIGMLDLCDHGEPGQMEMGDARLFCSDARPASPLLNWELARGLSPFLACNAQVRLLGCNTVAPDLQPLVTGSEGRLLLLKLAMELQAERVALGTITRITRAEFDCDGFNASHARLFSSLAALDLEPVSAKTRDFNIEDFMKPYTNRPTEPYVCRAERPSLCRWLRDVANRVSSVLQRR